MEVLIELHRDRRRGSSDTDGTGLAPQQSARTSKATGTVNPSGSAQAAVAPDASRSATAAGREFPAGSPRAAGPQELHGAATPARSQRSPGSARAAAPVEQSGTASRPAGPAPRSVGREPTTRTATAAVAPQVGVATISTVAAVESRTADTTRPE